MIAISKITDYVMNLKYLKRIDAKTPKSNPTTRLQKNSNMNKKQNSKETVKIVSCFPDNKSTEIYRMIDTASFTIPSPNTTLNSFGYLLGLIIVNAATESVAQIVAANIIIYSVLNFIVVSLPNI